MICKYNKQVLKNQQTRRNRIDTTTDVKNLDNKKRGTNNGDVFDAEVREGIRGAHVHGSEWSTQHAKKQPQIGLFVVARGRGRRNRGCSSEWSFHPLAPPSLSARGVLAAVGSVRTFLERREGLGGPEASRSRNEELRRRRVVLPAAAEQRGHGRCTPGGALGA